MKNKSLIKTLEDAIEQLRKPQKVSMIPSSALLNHSESKLILDEIWYDYEVVWPYLRYYPK